MISREVFTYPARRITLYFAVAQEEWPWKGSLSGIVCNLALIESIRVVAPGVQIAKKEGL